MRLLVLASESERARTILAALQTHSFDVDVAPPAEATAGGASGDYQAIILDLDAAPPRTFDGLSALRRMRRNGWTGRILVLKTSSTVADRVAALNAGADDFLSKPVDSDELAARIEALLRRGEVYSTVLRVADLEVDPAKRKVRRGGKTIVLTRREFDLLEFLVRHRDRPLTRARILRHVWNHHFDGLTNVVDVYIAYLRRKIDDGFPVKLISTERGVGYAVRDPLGEAAGAAMPVFQV